MGKYDCKLCNTAFDVELQLKKHARKVHDCSVFAALNPAKLNTKQKISDIKGVVKISAENNPGIETKNLYLVLINGTWEQIAKLPLELRKAARTMYKQDKGKKTTTDRIEVTKVKGELKSTKVEREPVEGDNENVEIIKPTVTPRAQKKPVIVSHSMIKSFLNCQQAWHYAYIDKIVPKIVNPKMSKGTLVHAAFEAAWYAVHGYKYKKHDLKPALKAARLAMKQAVSDKIDEFMSDKKLLAIELEELERTAQTALDVARFQFPKLYARFEPLDIGGVPAVEYQIILPFKKTAKLHSTIDLIAKDRRDGLIWCIDYKTRSAFHSTDTQEYNIQMAVYQYQLLKVGIQTAGSMIWEVWHEPPKEPELLKDCRGLSQQLIKTDWRTYKKAIETHGFDERAYEAMKKKLESVVFFQEARAYRNTTEVVNTFENVTQPAIEKIVETVRKIEQGKFQPQRNIGSMATNCPSCAYNTLCMESLRGRDTKHLLEDFVENSYLKKYEDM